MFRNQAQIGRVCAALTESDAHAPWFDAGGPTEAAEHAREHTTELGPSERAVLELAFCLWEGGRGPGFGSLVGLLDARRLRMLGSLLMALADGRAAVDRWLRANGGPVGQA